MNTATMERPATKIARVTVQYVNPAKSPGKSGSIKDVDGQYFGVKPAMLAQFQPGESYEIEFGEKIVNGVMYRDIKAANPVRAQADPAENYPSRQATRREAPAEPRGEPQRQPQNGNGNGYYRPTHPRDAERMFVCATLGHFIDRGAVDAEVAGMVDAVNVLREVWRVTFGADDTATG